ncbi:MAG TPA: hypothetical protein VMB48_06155, partial [Steroidobacteraceae bacterium]|nr:hypothetical protein [Steroidobacteraceae bacterium]
LARSLADSIVDFRSMARAIGSLCRDGALVVLDEFQFFTRAKLRPFTSHLQSEVDQLRMANLKRGGLLVLGSIQMEMAALLEDNSAPLYGRTTEKMHLDHWDFEDLLSVFRHQQVLLPEQWLTLWTFFEGVPKYYHDAHENGLFDVPPSQLPAELLTRLFIRSGAPLSDEADTTFLRELRGRVVSILHHLARCPGSTFSELEAALKPPVSEPKDNNIGAFLGRLVNDYAMVEKLNPIFSKDGKGRNARYYISDNFLQAWLNVARHAQDLARLKPLARALPSAITRLETLEGISLERLIRKLHVECSRKGKGDFDLSEVKIGYWNRPANASRSIEIDVVAIDEANKRIRFGSCKRNPAAHSNASLDGFEGHIGRFLAAPQYRYLAAWKTERVLFSPAFTSAQRDALRKKGYECLDLQDYARLFPA